ncbi:hypothetical protein ATL41_1548 [Flavimobilis soli]|uniref:Uncharacterized protein n=1 Tax=Flavimobilis soli TaxID=442709 RepID=A0A2A9EF08_9MICO|nr:hypothetical protein [Flavimobilis soli]PFG36809.1 hypothetical protein ATL41_1548 [Flavimobilis soli]
MTPAATGGEVAAVAAPPDPDVVSILAAFPVAQSAPAAPDDAPAAAPTGFGLAMLGDAGAACEGGVCAVPGASA